MGREPEQTFFRGRQTDGQQTHAKMLNITNHQGNANQNHKEILPHINQNGYHQKEHITNVGKDVEKKEPWCIVGGNANN